jgi:hypothetical protein
MIGKQERHAGLRLVAGLLALLALLQLGCAAKAPRLLSSQDRDGLGTVGVTAARYPPQARIKGPGQTGGVAGIAVGGVGAAAATIAACLPNPLALITCPSLVLTMTALGASAGGVIGHQINARVSGSKIEAAGPDGLDDPRMQKVLRDRVIEQVGARRPSVAIDDPAPSGPADKPDYSVLAARGIDTVVEIALLELATEGRPAQGLSLALSSRIRVIRVASGAVIGEETFRYRSEGHPYEKWTDPESGVFRTTLERGYRSIADHVAEELTAGPR